jgi:hypothetical protein
MDATKTSFCADDSPMTAPNHQHRDQIIGVWGTLQSNDDFTC